MATRKAVIVCTRAPYDEVEELVRGGLELGYYRAHKHVDDPDGEAIRAAQLQAIMENLSEWTEMRWRRAARP